MRIRRPALAALIVGFVLAFAGRSSFAQTRPEYIPLAHATELNSTWCPNDRVENTLEVLKLRIADCRITKLKTNLL